MKNETSPAAANDGAQGNGTIIQHSHQAPWLHECCSVPVRVWLQPKLKAALEELAEQDNRKLSEFIRHIAARVALGGAQ